MALIYINHWDNQALPKFFQGSGGFLRRLRQLSQEAILVMPIGHRERHRKICCRSVALLSRILGRNELFARGVSKACCVVRNPRQAKSGPDVSMILRSKRTGST